MTARDWDDPVVRDGMRRMLDHRSRLHESGDRTIGWKLGFGAPTWLEKLDLAGPLLGFLPESKRYRPGATVSCEGWVRPVAEPEVAVHLGRDVDDPAEAGTAISGIGAAIELADVDAPPEDIADVLAGNIFHRGVILGEPDSTREGGLLTGMRARVDKNGTQVVDTADLESLTGKVVSTLSHTAALLTAAGEKLRAGEVVIMGSIIPPVSLEPGDQIGFELSPLAPISVNV